MLTAHASPMSARSAAFRSKGVGFTQQPLSCSVKPDATRRILAMPRARVLAAAGSSDGPQSISDRLKSDMKDAMKARDQPRLEAIRFISASVKSREIEMRTESPDKAITDEDVIKVLMKSAKQRKDSIDSYRAGGRQDLVDKETKELSIIEQYLPAMMPEPEVKALVDATCTELGASSLKDMGKVMGKMMERTKGLADNKLVSALVKSKLSGQ